jgi:hypothetical protein
MIILPIPLSTVFARTSRLRWPSGEDMADMAEGQFFVTIQRADPPMPWTAMFFRKDSSNALGWDFVTSTHASTKWGIHRQARRMIARYQRPTQFEVWK